MPRIVDWYMEGKIRIDELISDVIPLERMHEGEAIRTVVRFDESAEVARRPGWDAGPSGGAASRSVAVHTDLHGPEVGRAHPIALPRRRALLAGTSSISRASPRPPG